jgi:hypothetical protein
MRNKADSLGEENELEVVEIKPLGSDSYDWGEKYKTKFIYRGKVVNIQKTLKDITDINKMIAINSIGIEVLDEDYEDLENADANAYVVFAMYNIKQ